MQIISYISHNLASASIKKDRAKKFIEGLNNEYFMFIKVQEDITYEKVFNKVLELESRMKTRKREMQSESC